MRSALQAALAIVLVWTPAVAQSCSGCGCKGGPGYRGPDGRCVGWANIGRVCGSPPATHCTPEGPNANASEAAELGVRAINSRLKGDAAPPSRTRQ